LSTAPPDSERPAPFPAAAVLMEPSSLAQEPEWSNSDLPLSSDLLHSELPDARPDEPALSRLVVVANRAPVRREDDGAWEASVGGLATALLPVLERHGGVWVAMREDDDPTRQRYPEADPAFTIRRVPMTDEERVNYYEGMANSVLWPVSHYLLQHLALERAFIEDYRAVNRRFAEAVIAEAEPDDAIWVHDYHLMLLPQIVREALPEARLAHFWHIPWPAMEVFRILPWARELIRGLLGCDLIGFHVEEYVDNFRESAHVLLGAELTDGGVRWDGREVRVEAHPIGVDVAYFSETAAEARVRRAAEQIREEAAADFLFLGVDRLDY